MMIKQIELTMTLILTCISTRRGNGDAVCSITFVSSDGSIEFEMSDTYPGFQEIWNKVVEGID